MHDMKPYKLAKVADRSGDLKKKWYVRYSLWHPAKERYIEIRTKGGINRFHTKTDRMEAALNLCASINANLKKGLFINPVDEFTEKEKIAVGQSLKLSEAIEVYSRDHLLTHDIEKRTRETYVPSFNRLKEYFKKEGEADPAIDKITRKELRTFITTVQRERDWSNVTRNACLIHLRAFFNFLVNQEYLKESPVKGIEMLKEKPTKQNRPPSEEEFEIIVRHLRKHDKTLLLFMSIIYYTGFRPSEIGSLQVKNFLFSGKNPYIFLPSKNVKNNKDRMQFIPAPLVEMIREYGVLDLPQEWYLFGYQLKPGAKRNTCIRNRITERWKRVIKQRLGIDVDLYSMKHLQSIRLEMAGQNIHRIKDWLGHSSVATTEIYMKRWRPASTVEFLNNFKKLPE